MLGRIRSLFAQPAALPWAQPYSPNATATDIFHCFRLLLGRNPEPSEWPGHSMRTGEALPRVVASYLASLEFARRNLVTQGLSQSLQIARLPEFQIYVSADDLDVGRDVLAGNYEKDVAAVFRRVLRPGMAVVDVGANIGYFTMLSASIVGATGQVLAVEPNPRNVRLLEASRRLNGFAQVTVAQVAAGRETGILVLHAAHSNGTTSAPSADLEALLAAETVPALRLDDLVQAGRPIGLIKVDVEGAEYNALLGGRGILERDRPTIISEFSPGYMPGISGIDGAGYLRWIVARGYRIGVVRPDGSVSAPGTEPEPVLAEHQARGTDHIDIVATPA